VKWNGFGKCILLHVISAQFPALINKTNGLCHNIDYLKVSACTLPCYEGISYLVQYCSWNKNVIVTSEYWHKNQHSMLTLCTSCHLTLECTQDPWALSRSQALRYSIIELSDYMCCCIVQFRMTNYFCCSLFYNTVSIANGRVAGEQWTGKDLEGSVLGLIEILSQYFPGGIEENQEKPLSG
jgi:hypothetical protein